MKSCLRFALLLFPWLACAALASAQTLSPDLPTWWVKYQSLLKNGSGIAGAAASSVAVGSNVDVSNEIFRLPMRGYFSSDGGSTWGGVDLPLPPPIGTNGVNFGSDPSLAFDTRGTVF